MVLTDDAYNETIEEKQDKDKQLQSFKERMANIENILVTIQPLLQQVTTINHLLQYRWTNYPYYIMKKIISLKSLTMLFLYIFNTILYFML